MPTYDYECKDCGHRFEAFQSMSDPKLTECPSCGGNVERLLGTGAGVIFKGSGFYQTDYRSDSYKAGAKADSSSSSDSSSKSSPKDSGAASKAESKPAPKKADG